MERAEEPSLTPRVTHPTSEDGPSDTPADAGSSASASSSPRWNATCVGPSSPRWRAPPRRVGFDSIWLGDHLLYRGDGRPERGPWDAWTTLAAIAASTERVRLGPLVACAAFHPPGMLARMAASVDEVSGGRFVLGIGAGWNETEFRAFGIPFEERASRFEESFEVVRRLLAGERVTFDGRSWTSTTPSCCRRPRGAPADDRQQRRAAAPRHAPARRRVEHVVRRATPTRPTGSRRCTNA